MLFDIAYSFVNIFAGGRSEIKTFLFIFYFLLLILLSFACKNYHFKALKWKYFGANLLIMYLYGLILHLAYVISNRLALMDIFIVGNNGELSCSSLWHTHVAKGVVGEFFSWFGKIQFSKMDAGGAYLGTIPDWIFSLGLIILIVLVIQAVLYFITFLKETLKDKNKRQKIFLIIGYAIFSFSLIKTSIDGGIFNRGFYISLIFVILFILREKGKNITHYFYLLSTVGLLLLVASYTGILKYGDFWEITSTIALLLLYNFILYGSQKKIKLPVLIWFLILFSAAWWVYSARDRHIFDYAKISLPAGEQVYFYNDNRQEIENFIIPKKQTIKELTKKLDKNLTYFPISVRGITCSEKKQPTKFFIDIISSNPINKDDFTSSGYLQINNESSIALKNKWRTKLSIMENRCFIDKLSILDGELRKSGINNYLLINPMFYDTANIE